MERERNRIRGDEFFKMDSWKWNYRNGIAVTDAQNDFAGKDLVTSGEIRVRQFFKTPILLI